LIAAVISTELQLALAPARTYRQLVTERSDATWRAALAGPAFALLAIGVLVSIVATGHVTVALAATLSVSWSFAVLIQVLAAAVIIVSARDRRVSRRRAFELLFLAHAPWSLWLLAVAAFSLLAARVSLDAVAATALIPVGWTAILVSAFSREVLHAGRREARLRTVAHQAIVWGCAVQFAAMAAGSWNRLVQGVLGS
jgi:energy-converting hydrogenase Eha subunit C